MSKVRVVLEFDSYDEMLHTLAGAKIYTFSEPVVESSATLAPAETPEEPPQTPQEPQEPQAGDGSDHYFENLRKKYDASSASEPTESTETGAEKTVGGAQPTTRTRAAYLHHPERGYLQTWNQAEVDEWLAAGAKRIKKTEYEAEMAKREAQPAAPEPESKNPTPSTVKTDGYPEFNGLIYLKDPAGGAMVAAKTFEEMKAKIDAGWVEISREEYERPSQFKKSQEEADKTVVLELDKLVALEQPKSVDAHQALKLLVAATSVAKGREVLARHGADRLSALKEEDYGAFIQACRDELSA